MHENILKIDQITGTISFLNETIDIIIKQLKPLFMVRRFLFLHTESLIDYSRIRSLLGQMKSDIYLIKAYLNIHSTGKLTPYISDNNLKIHK